MCNWLINKNRKNLPYDPEMERILSGSDAYAFHRSLDYYKPTPLVSLPGLAEKLGIASLQIKDESQRFGLNAFKGLGASYAVDVFLRNNRGKYNFCTATDGNHGRALAWAARIYKQACTVFVPEHISRERIRNIEKEGTRVIIIEGDYDATVEAAEEYSRKDGNILIQDSSWEGYIDIPAHIMAGYMTSCAELGKDDRFDIIFLQGGVGSWASSVIWYFLNVHGADSPKFVIVEPENSCGIFDSALKGYRSKPINPGDTIMAGLNCGIPSSLAWPIIYNNTDCFIKISDLKAKEAMRQLYSPDANDSQIISGESGAASLGALIFALDSNNSELKEYLDLNPTTRILLFNTEGDTDGESYWRIVNG